MPDYHELEHELDDQLARTARFRRMAFHVHSLDSHDWGKEGDRETNNIERFQGAAGMDAYLDELAAQLDIVCITDHMKSGLACELSRRAQSREDLDLVVFPGMEVSCRVPPGHTDAIHVLVVFAPGTTPDVIDRIFAGQTDLPGHEARTGHEEISVDALAEWGKSITDAGALFVFAHVDQPQRGHRAYVRRRRGESMEMMGADLDAEAVREISNEYAEHLVALAPSAVEVKEGGEDREHYARFTTADGRVHSVAGSSERSRSHGRAALCSQVGRASGPRPLWEHRARRRRRSLARRSSSLRDARRHLWKGRSDRSRVEKLWPLTATQPTFRLRPSCSIGSGGSSSATKAERVAEFRRAKNELERASGHDPGVVAISRQVDAG